MPEQMQKVGYSPHIKRLIYTGFVIFAVISFALLHWSALPFVILGGCFAGYMEGTYLTFEPETGMLCWHTLFAKPYRFHASEIQTQMLRNTMTKNGRRIFLTLQTPRRAIMILLGEPSGEERFAETWDSYTNAAELLAFLEQYHPTEEQLSWN